MKWIYSIITGVIIIIISSIVVINNKGTNKYSEELNKIINTSMNYDQLKNIYYDKSGDMIGSLEEISIDIDKKTLQYRHRNSHDMPVEVEVYTITNDDIKTLKQWISKYNLPAWSKLKLRNITTYDAASEIITLRYDNSSFGGDDIEWYTISFDMEIPDDGYPLIRGFRDKMYSYIDSNNLIEKYIEEKDRFNE